MRVVKHWEISKADWDAFVLSHPLAWVGHLADICKIEKELTGATNQSLVVLNEQDQIIALLPLFEMTEQAFKLVPIRLLNTGSQLRSGPLIAASAADRNRDKILDVLIATISQMATEHQVDRTTISYPVFVGTTTALNHYRYLPIRRFGYQQLMAVSMIIDLSESLDQLSKRLSKSCRRKIKNCQQDAGEFCTITDKQDWLQCYDINRQTLGESCYSKRAMELIWDKFVVPGHVIITGAKYRGEIVSVSATAMMNQVSYAWLGFNGQPRQIRGSDNMVVWETMLMLKERGIRYFEVGSLEFDDEKQIQIGAFKKSFGGVPTGAFAGELIHRPIKNSLLKLTGAMRRELANLSLF